MLIYSRAKDADRFPMTARLGLSCAGRTLRNMRTAIATVATVMALSYVMNQSGQTLAIGTWLAAAGGLFALLSPVLGWLGTAVTGSDTSSNALFATLQQTAGKTAGIDPTLLVAANTTGGVVGKLISPQNLTIAATAVERPGTERILLRKVMRLQRRDAGGPVRAGLSPVTVGAVLDAAVDVRAGEGGVGPS